LIRIYYQKNSNRKSIFSDKVFYSLENTLAQLFLAKNTNIELIKKYEEKKLEEHRYFKSKNQS
jgi:hypothetical protein